MSNVLEKVSTAILTEFSASRRLALLNHCCNALVGGCFGSVFACAVADKDARMQIWIPTMAQSAAIAHATFLNRWAARSHAIQSALNVAVLSWCVRANTFKSIRHAGKQHLILNKEEHGRQRCEDTRHAWHVQSPSE